MIIAIAFVGGYNVDDLTSFVGKGGSYVVASMDKKIANKIPLDKIPAYKPGEKSRKDGAYRLGASRKG